MSPKLIAALVTAVALPAAAQTATPRVDQRQAAQEARMQQGKESQAKADGNVTARERARLAKAQNKQGRKIAKQKHDKQKKATAT